MICPRCRRPLTRTVFERQNPETEYWYCLPAEGGCGRGEMKPREETMRFCYADPPYIGQAHRYPEKTEVDHAALIARLELEYPDGWALSLSSPSLRIILPLCPDDARVMAWVKPFAIFKPNVNPAYAWEPVIVRGGRKRGREIETVRDWVSANVTLGRGIVGAKPEGFCFALFDWLGMQASDEFVDLFPGSGAVTEAWQKWQRIQTDAGWSQLELERVVIA